jgi:integrase
MTKLPPTLSLVADNAFDNYTSQRSRPLEVIGLAIAHLDEKVAAITIPRNIWRVISLHPTVLPYLATLRASARRLSFRLGPFHFEWKGRQKEARELLDEALGVVPGTIRIIEEAANVILFESKTGDMVAVDKVLTEGFGK